MNARTCPAESCLAFSTLVGGRIFAVFLNCFADSTGVMAKALRFIPWPARPRLGRREPSSYWFRRAWELPCRALAIGLCLIVLTCQRASRSSGLRAFAAAMLRWTYFSNAGMMPCELRLPANKATSKYWLHHKVGDQPGLGSIEPPCRRLSTA